MSFWDFYFVKKNYKSLVLSRPRLLTSDYSDVIWHLGGVMWHLPLIVHTYDTLPGFAILRCEMWDTQFSLILQIAEHSQEWNGDDDEWSVFRSSQPQWRQVPTQCWARSLHYRNGCRQTLRAKTEQENCPVNADGFCGQTKSYQIYRIFTVILYMFSVSLGAILLSLYYVFIWKNPHTQALDKKVV